MVVLGGRWFVFPVIPSGGSLPLKVKAETHCEAVGNNGSEGDSSGVGGSDSYGSKGKYSDYGGSDSYGSKDGCYYSRRARERTRGSGYSGSDRYDSMGTDTYAE